MLTFAPVPLRLREKVSQKNNASQFELKVSVCESDAQDTVLNTGLYLTWGCSHIV